MNDKLVTLDELFKKTGRPGSRTARMVFTNGCFDLIHAGHVRFLKTAKKLGDVLVVGLNTDSSVRRIKGEKRPIVGHEMRAEVLAAISWVDFIVLFDEPDPSRLVSEILPDVLVKGADWSEENIIGARTVIKAGGTVERIELIDGISTSQIIAKIVSGYGSASS
ncbi:MAG: D-glycero-beta-D-manno-heptose 1-phosphate adenylyltransferase [Deltaproteobacteria bacterium]|nr:D-glycero-beta-D-manno-heptose 1-phosphate adenylyltransferase [Deltaproteobacteria bacterium]